MLYHNPASGARGGEPRVARSDGKAATAGGGAASVLCEAAEAAADTAEANGGPGEKRTTRADRAAAGLVEDSFEARGVENPEDPALKFRASGGVNARVERRRDQTEALAEEQTESLTIRLDAAFFTAFAIAWPEHFAVIEIDYQRHPLHPFPDVLIYAQVIRKQLQA